MDRSVCLIGAGVAGIASAYALSRRGVRFDWFEGGSKAGGLWRYDNDNGRSAVYASLITNTSAPNTTLFGFRMPELGSGYLKHSQVLNYLEGFLDQAELCSRVVTATWVTSVERTADGRFRVALRGEGDEVTAGEYTDVVVATGRNWCPEIPVIPGSFDGLVMHSLGYRTAEPLVGKRVIIVGFGNTGADIAVEAAGCAANVILSTRRGGPLASRYVKGRPADQARSTWFYLLPLEVRRMMAGLRRAAHGGRVTGAAAVLERDAGLGGKPPVINDQIASMINSGAVLVKPEIRRCDGRTVTFADGSSTEADAIIWATGYRSSYPFFSTAMLTRNGHFRDRYLRVVAPEEPGLYFVGQAAVVGPVFPVLEAQAQFVADAIAGACALPHAARLKGLAEDESARNRRVLRQATRGEDTVETYPYVRMLRRASGRPQSG